MANAGRVADPEAAVYFVAITKAGGTNMAQPVIGLTLDHEPPGGYSKTIPGMRCARIIATRCAAAGGLPILLPHEPERARRTIST